MNCSSCGSTVTPGLSYCNRCGAELNTKSRQASTPSEVPPEYLIWGILAVSVGGLGVILALMAVMKKVLNFSTELTVGFSLLSFLLLVAAECVFIWMLVRQRSISKEVANPRPLKEQATKDGGAARVLSEPAPTVTEHTTRTLEPANRTRAEE